MGCLIYLNTKLFIFKNKICFLLHQIDARRYLESVTFYLYMSSIIGQTTHLSISQFSYSYFKILKYLAPKNHHKHPWNLNSPHICQAIKLPSHLAKHLAQSNHEYMNESQI
ncbi:hypothetical protein F975_02326 [Acinetobacter sp. ANC 3789]|nr:hypothetical protein F975_02326 [Acinetobacter sp. ANC 3789]